MSSPAFPFTCLEINGLTSDNLERVCAYAKRFHIGAIAYMSAEWKNFQFLDHTAWGVPPANDEARRFMENYQETIRAASEIVRSHGLDFYLWRRELRLPTGFVEKYGADWIDFKNPELWDLVRWNIESLFTLFPATQGIILSCTGEQKAGEWISANGMGGGLPLWQRFEKMFRTVKETCDRLDRRVVFRNHGAGNDAIPLVTDENTYTWHFLKAAAAVGPDLLLMGKAVEPDFQPTYPFNAPLALMAQQQPTIVEFSLPMEYCAVGRTPFPMVEDIKFRLQKAREIRSYGVAGRIDWHMTSHRSEQTWSCLDTFNEINAYAFCRLLNAPATSVEEIHRDFACERFGDRAAHAAAAIFKNLYEAGCKTYYEFGHHSCSTPSGAPLTPDGMIAALRRHNITRWSFSPVDYANHVRALAPDHHFLRRVEAEKSEALAIYDEAIRTLNAAREAFAGDDAGRLGFSLQRAFDEAAIRRDYMVGFYAWMAFDDTGEAGYEKIAADRLAALDTVIPAYHKKYDGLEAPDPDAGDIFQFGVCARDSSSRLAHKLEESRQYWRSPGSTGECTRIRPSDVTEGAVEIQLNSSRFVVNPFRCEVLGITTHGRSLIQDPVPLVAFHLGGLTEEGYQIGRSLSKPRMARFEDGSEEIRFPYGYQGTEIALRSAVGSDSLHVRCRYRNLPCAGVLEFPWVRLMSEGRQNPAPNATWPIHDDAEISLTVALET